jgi:hypothetical protein
MTTRHLLLNKLSSPHLKLHQSKNKLRLRLKFNRHRNRSLSRSALLKRIVRSKWRGAIDKMTEMCLFSVALRLREITNKMIKKNLSREEWWRESTMLKVKLSESHLGASK